MKKVIVIVSTLLLLLSMIGFAVSALWDREGVATSGAKPWPVGGTLESVAGRYGAMQANEPSVRLLRLGRALPRNVSVDEYLSSETRRADGTIGQPPTLPDASEIRELLLSQPVVWEREAGVAEVGDAASSERRGVQMTIARVLVANALAKARANDLAAWEDLRAVWNLSRSLEAQPQMMMQTAALTMVRMINASAWKMPMPPPAWFAQLQQHDFIESLLASFQYQSAAYWADGSMFPTSMLAQSAEHDRQLADAVARQENCEVTIPMNRLGTDLSSVWRRAFRYRAEREATANAIRLRLGMPIEPTSRCADGAWTFDGRMLRFSRDITTPAPDAAMPLTLLVNR